MQPFDALAVPLEGRLLVEASAGTGKTHAITTLFLRLLVESGLGVDRILVVTFTEAATAELKVRLRARLAAALATFEGCEAPDADLAALVAKSSDRALAAARLRFALRHVDEAAVFTIHGFCQRTLRECAFESGSELDAELSTDLVPLLDEVLCDYWTRELAGASRALVLRLRRDRVWPDTHRGIADRVAQNPYTRVLPEGMPSVEDAPTAAFLEAYRRVAERWDRARIEAELLHSPALNRSRYREKTVRSSCDTMAAFLAAGPPALPQLFKGFELFRASVLAEHCKRGWANKQPSGPFYTACDWLARSVEEHERIAALQVIAFRRRLVDWVRSELPKRKRRSGVMAFSDLLLRLHDALAGAQGARLAETVRRRYPAALIDEFQDTDPIQYAIFDRIWRDGSLFLIGDPKQAIYAFRGADVFAYLGAAQAVPDERRFTMGVNWRSDASLVQAVGVTLGAPASPFLLEAIELPEVRAQAGDRLGAPALRILFARRDAGGRPISKTRARERIPHAIAADLAALLRSDASIEGRRVAPADIAILTRSNDQAFDMQRALRKAGVRSVVLGDQSVFEDAQPEAREVEQVLAAVAEPTRTPLVRAALLSSLFGLGASELARMEVEPGETSLEAWIGRFRAWHARWLQRGFVQMFRALVSEAGVVERLLRLADGERRVTNLLHLQELLHTAAGSLHLGPAGLIGWLREQRAQARARPESAQIRLESDERAVKITTVHKSKGLEYPIVYAPYLWDGRLLSSDEERELFFHDRDAGDALVLSLDPDERALRQARLEKLAESLRLSYVALTRARHRATVVWGGFTDFETSALGYTLHPPVLALRSPSVDDVRGHLVNLDDERMLRDLSALAAEEPAIEVRELDLNAAAPSAPSAAPVSNVALAARAMERPVKSWWRMASFTELLSTSAPSDDVARDRDETPAAPGLEPESAASEGAIALADFPRGARAGNFFHELLEHLDFAEPLRDPSATRARVDALLSAYRYDAALGEAVMQAIGDVVRTPLAPPGRKPIRLCDVPTTQRLAELEFHLPVAGAALGRALPRGTQLELSFAVPGQSPAQPVVTAERLAAVFADHPSERVGARYAERVARLGFVPLEGFLKGYIDLVFARHGRFYLCDYKTTHLGDALASYAGARLDEAMEHAHYHLQSHLYALALHRHLQRRQPGYRYESHFGGMYYLFLKGMTPSRGAACGVHFERPPRGRIEALSDLLDQPGGRR